MGSIELCRIGFRQIDTIWCMIYGGTFAKEAFKGIEKPSAVTLCCWRISDFVNQPENVLHLFRLVFTIIAYSSSWLGGNFQPGAISIYIQVSIDFDLLHHLNTVKLSQ